MASDPNLSSVSRAGTASERYDPERHHRRSIRLAGYDYGAAGAYFVTVCTHGRSPLFGGVVDGRTRVTEAGRFVWSAWLPLPLHHRHVCLDAFVVMPDHVHGIVWSRGEPAPVRGGARSRPQPQGRLVGAGLRPAPTEPASARDPARPPDPAPVALPEIVRAFKSFSARSINGHRGTPGRPVWQRNYYEHIVRDAGALRRIRAYVRANPDRWVAAERRPRGGPPDPAA